MTEKTKQETSQSKPEVKLSGEDGNIFNLLFIVCNALRVNGQSDRAKELCEAVNNSHSYDEALEHIAEYVDVV